MEGFGKFLSFKAATIVPSLKLENGHTSGSHRMMSGSQGK
jgi:hypothetical protein